MYAKVTQRRDYFESRKVMLEKGMDISREAVGEFRRYVSGDGLRLGIGVKRKSRVSRGQHRKLLPGT